MSNPSISRLATPIVKVIAIALITGTASISAAPNSLVDHTIRWTGSTPVKSHTGLLSPSSFSVSLSDQGEIQSLKVVLDMKSIDVTDIEGKSRDRLTSHLMSEDFFHVEKFPGAEFEMREYKNGEVHGTMRIRGIARPFTIPVEVKGNAGSGWILSGRFAFNRQDFNVNYANAGIIGIAKDKIIADDIVLDIELRVK